MPAGHRTIAPLALCAALTLAACGSDDDSARDEAVDRAVEQGVGRDVAECVVDATVDEWGEDALDPTFEVPPEHVDRSFEILDECLFGG
ncbi:MAG: hypothetical protein AAGA99_11055 [Actinomycetota bacterium]